MTKIPKPQYDYATDKLVAQYKRAVHHIYQTLERIDITVMTRAQMLTVLKEIASILSELNEESALWVAENIPIAARNGVLTALVALEVKGAEKIVAFNRLNRELIASIVADTQADLLAVTQNITRRVRIAVRQVVAEVMRANMTRGINGRRTLNREILAGLRKKLGDSVNTGIIDAAGRRWKPEVYVDMVTRTKMSEARREATRNEAVSRGAYYGVISRHNAIDACSRWEGRVIKLVRDAAGEYPYMGDIPRRECFHPNCSHVITPIRNPK